MESAYALVVGPAASLQVDEATVRSLEVAAGCVDIGCSSDNVLRIHVCSIGNGVLISVVVGCRSRFYHYLVV